MSPMSQWLAIAVAALIVFGSVFAASIAVADPHADTVTYPGREDSVEDVFSTTRMQGARFHFEANRGQVHEDVEFFARTDAYTFFLTRSEVVFSLNDAVVRVEFVDAQPKIAFDGGDPLPGRSNYFFGDDPAEWSVDVPHHSRVEARGIWSGIDAVFYGTDEGAIQYDFIVAPGADPNLIRLSYSGGTISMDEDGSLIVRHGDKLLLRQPAPYTYQVVDEGLVEVPSGFRLEDQHVISFWTGEYDKSLPLVIDPIALGYSTFIGGSYAEDRAKLSIDAQGSAYLTGYTNSADFPTKNAFQSSAPSILSGFVTKLSPDGSEIVYSTFLGGSGHDFLSAVAVGSDGSAVVVGRTSSTDFPLRNAYQTINSGGFVTKLAPSGNRLVFSTYLGTTWGGVAIDDGGDLYLAGSSGGRPSVTKLAAAGDAILFDIDAGPANSIAIDSHGHAYVIGTAKNDYVTVNAFQPENPSPGLSSAVVAKIRPTGDGLVYATYLGGSSLDFGNGIAVDADGFAYVTGETRSADFPTVNALQSMLGGSSSAFVTKLSADGSHLVYSTYLGGSNSDYGSAIAVDGSGSAYVTGCTRSTNFPLLLAYQTSHGGDNDVFVAKLAPSGSELVFSTLLGGSLSEFAGAIAVGADDTAYVSGVTDSQNFPTSNRLQNYRGNRDAFVVKLSPHGPGVPVNVVAQAGPGAKEITLMWDYPLDDGGFPVTSFNVYYHWGTLIGSTDGDARSFTVTGLPDDYPGTFRIHAVNPAGEGARSNFASARTFTVPSAPQDLRANPGLEPTTVVLSWNPPAGDGGTPVHEYRIYRHILTGGGFVFLGTVDSVNRQYIDRPEELLKPYAYLVTARNIVGEGAASGACGKAMPWVEHIRVHAVNVNSCAIEPPSSVVRPSIDDHAACVAVERGCGYNGVGPTSVLESSTCTSSGRYSCGQTGLGATSVAGASTCESSGDSSCGSSGTGAISVLDDASCTSSGRSSCGFAGVGAASVAGNAHCSGTGSSSCGSTGAGAMSLAGDADCTDTCGSIESDRGFGAVSLLGSAQCARPLHLADATSAARAECASGRDLAAQAMDDPMMPLHELT